MGMLGSVLSCQLWCHVTLALLDQESLGGRLLLSQSSLISR